jgi:hypothetical protein
MVDIFNTLPRIGGRATASVGCVLAHLIKHGPVQLRLGVVLNLTLPRDIVFLIIIDLRDKECGVMCMHRQLSEAAPIQRYSRGA